VIAKYPRIQGMFAFENHWGTLMTKFTENHDFNDFLINKPVWANRRLIFAIFNTDRNTGRQTDERIKARTNEQTNPI